MSWNKNLQGDWQGFTFSKGAGEFDGERWIDLFKACEELDPELKVIYCRGMRKEDGSDNTDSCGNSIRMVSVKKVWKRSPAPLIRETFTVLLDPEEK